jgi:hypothetical protein
MQYFKVMFQHSPGLRKTTKKFSQDYQSLYKYLILGPPKCTNHYTTTFSYKTEGDTVCLPQNTSWFSMVIATNMILVTDAKNIHCMILCTLVYTRQLNNASYTKLMDITLSMTDSLYTLVNNYNPALGQRKYSIFYCTPSPKILDIFKNCFLVTANQ